MAQRAHAKRRMLLQARRLGLGSRASVAAALALVVAAGVVGFGRLKAQEGFEIERTEQGQAMAADADPQVPQDAVTDSDENEPTSVVVHVDGAVQTPGVYELVGEGPRVNDAVSCAGGLAGDADTTAVNLASPVTDGQKVHIPRVGEVAEQAPAAPAAPDAGAPVEAAATGLINVNAATAEELMALPGVGEATAAAIVEERSANGPFASPEDLMRVSGIGEKKFAKMQGLICV